MDKQKVVYSYDGILFSHKKEQSSDTCYNMMNPENIIVTDRRQTRKAMY